MDRQLFSSDALLNSLVTPAWIYDVSRYQVCWANDSALKLWNAPDKETLYQRDLSVDITEVSDTQIRQLASDSIDTPVTVWWTLYPSNEAKDVYIRFSNVSTSDDQILLLCEAVLYKEEIERDTSFSRKNAITSLFDQSGCYLSGNLIFKNNYDVQSIDLYELLETSPQQLNKALKRTRDTSFEQQVISRGRLYWYDFHVTLLQPENHYLVVQEDITKRKTQEQTYKHLAYHDQLTGILNRYGLHDYLSTQCSANLPFNLFLLDLDGFKLINNNLGHSTGDKVLVAIAQRLIQQLPPDYQVSRFGGDEFIIVVPSKTDSQSIEAISQSIIEVVAQPIESIDSIQVSASIGAAHFPTDATEPNALIMYADTAMYKAKERGSQSYVRFAQQMSLEIQRRSAIQQGLKQAVELNELVPHFQPIVDMKTNTLVGMEALLSWDSPTLGLVSPQEFVAEAERSGMMNEIGQWILTQACMQCKMWQEMTKQPLRLSVNVSAIQLNDRFISVLDDILEKTQFPASCLTLELTESIFMLNIKQVIRRLQLISDRNISVCIDDFGTGYSSLAYIHKLPIDALKIDRSFINDIDNTIVVIEATIAMATKLGLKVVAEGIETQHQREVMLNYPNLLAQGFYYSRPVCAEDFEKLPIFEKFLPGKQTVDLFKFGK